MNIEKIMEIAEKCGFYNFEFYGPSKLTDMKDGTLKFLPSKEFTMHGKKLIAFANAIEKEAKHD